MSVVRINAIEVPPERADELLERFSKRAGEVYKQRMRSLRELMAQNEARADVTFVAQGDRRLTYGQHDRAARRTAAALATLGVAPGDRVAVISANNPEWLLTFWACAILGAI